MQFKRYGTYWKSGTKKLKPRLRRSVAMLRSRGKSSQGTAQVQGYQMVCSMLLQASRCIDLTLLSGLFRNLEILQHNDDTVSRKIHKWTSFNGQCVSKSVLFCATINRQDEPFARTTFINPSNGALFAPRLILF